MLGEENSPHNGHVSVDTTNIYAEADLEMKAKALARSEIPGLTPANKIWREEQGTMAFLRNLTAQL